jgi:hypothetical protein
MRRTQTTCNLAFIALSCTRPAVYDACTAAAALLALPPQSAAKRQQKAENCLLHNRLKCQLVEFVVVKSIVIPGPKSLARASEFSRSFQSLLQDHPDPQPIVNVQVWEKEASQK